MAPAATPEKTVRPFPWGSLDSVRPLDVEALRSIRRWCTASAPLAEALKALREIVDARVSVVLRRAQRGGRVRNLDDGVSVLLARADETEMGPGALVEVEGNLAAVLVARALKRPAPRVTSQSQPPSANVAGALAAILGAAARSSMAGAPLRVLAAGPSAELAKDFIHRAREFDVATVTVLVNQEAYLARLTIPTGTLSVAPDRWTRASLAALGEAQLEIPIVATATLATHREVAALAEGDAWMPGAWPLTRNLAGSWAGPVWLAPAATEVGFAAALGDGERLVLGGDTLDLTWSPAPEPATQKGSMEDLEGSAHLVQGLGDVPVVVRVEVGAARMRAREWAALGPGDVVALGRRVAEPVVLRVGGAEVATGELVEIDGEVGVRILALLQGEEVNP